MKKLFILLCFTSQLSFAQSDEAKQLLLNVEKLAQFKSIMQQMKDGYSILYKGYTAIQDISKGNFSLHKTFLDGLLQVSPAIRHYAKMADIIRLQLKIVKEYKVARQQFEADKLFTLSELSYIGKVYANLIRESFKVINELTLILTSGELRMTDDERLSAIDKLHDTVVDQYTFLNEFNNSTAILSIQREKEQMDVDLMRKIHGIPTKVP